VSFGNLVTPFPIGVAAIFFFLQSHYIGMLRPNLLPLPLIVVVGGNHITSCTFGGSTRNGLTPICSCEEMTTLRMARTPKNIGRV